MLKLINVIYTDDAYNLLDQIDNLKQLIIGYSSKRDLVDSFTEVLYTRENLQLRHIIISHLRISDICLLSISTM